MIDTWLPREERAACERRPLVTALCIFGGEFAALIALTALAVAQLPLVVNLIAALAAGMLIGTLFTVGHDAAHDTFTASRELNRWIARLAFVPSAHAVSLWQRFHNRTHHSWTNLRKHDYVWEPMSPAQYRALPPLRRALYRLCRGPFGSLPYHLGHMWWKRSFLPIAPEVRGELRKHAFDCTFVVVGWFAFGAACTFFGARLDPQRPLWATALLGWILPFLVANWVNGWVILLHHTHPSVPWFDDPREWMATNSSVTCTIHVTPPLLLDAISNNIMDHNAHHAAPTIPLYHLRPAQNRLRQHFAAAVHHVVLTPRSYLEIVSKCKLFDGERGQWTDFSGRPTGPVCLSRATETR